jgi:hypothetical protein
MGRPIKGCFTVWLVSFSFFPRFLWVFIVFLVFVGFLWFFSWIHFLFRFEFCSISKFSHIQILFKFRLFCPDWIFLFWNFIQFRILFILWILFIFWKKFESKYVQISNFVHIWNLFKSEFCVYTKFVQIQKIFKFESCSFSVLYKFLICAFPKIVHFKICLTFKYRKTFKNEKNRNQKMGRPSRRKPMGGTQCVPRWACYRRPLLGQLGVAVRPRPAAINCALPQRFPARASPPFAAARRGGDSESDARARRTGAGG